MNIRLVGLQLGLIKRAGLEKLLTLLKSPIGKGIGIGAATGGIGNSVREYLNNAGEKDQLTKTLKGGLTGAGVGGVLGGSLGAVFNKLRNKIPTHVPNLELDELIKNNPVSVLTRGHGDDYAYLGSPKLYDLKHYIHKFIPGEGPDGPHLVLSKLNDKFHLSFNGVPGFGITDFGRRLIRNNFEFLNLTEDESKHLLHKIFSNPHGESKFLNSLFKRNVPEILKDGERVGRGRTWDIDPNKVKEYITAPHIPIDAAAPNPFAELGLVDKLKTLNLTGKDGPKVFVGPTGLHPKMGNPEIPLIQNFDEPNWGIYKQTF